MKNFLLCLLLLTTVSCSRTSVIYRFADTMAISKTDDYFDLSGEQHDQLKKNLQKDLDVVRREYFPEIAKNLRELAPLANQEQLSEETVSRKSQELQDHMKKFATYFADTSVKTVLSLQSRQIDHFEKELREEIADNSDPEEQQEKAFKRYRRSLEFWIGGINAAQKEKIKSFLAAHPYPGQLQNQSRMHVLEKFLQVRRNPEQLKNFVTELVNDLEAVRLPSFTQSLKEHKAAFERFLARDLWPSFTKTQRDQLRETLLTRARELDEIAQRP